MIIRLLDNYTQFYIRAIAVLPKAIIKLIKNNVNKLVDLRFEVSMLSFTGVTAFGVGVVGVSLMGCVVVCVGVCRSWVFCASAASNYLLVI